MIEVPFGGYRTRLTGLRIFNTKEGGRRKDDRLLWFKGKRQGAWAGSLLLGLVKEFKEVKVLGKIWRPHALCPMLPAPYFFSCIISTCSPFSLTIFRFRELASASVLTTLVFELTITGKFTPLPGC